MDKVGEDFFRAVVFRHAPAAVALRALLPLRLPRMTKRGGRPTIRPLSASKAWILTPYASR